MEWGESMWNRGAAIATLLASTLAAGGVAPPGGVSPARCRPADGDEGARPVVRHRGAEAPREEEESPPTPAEEFRAIRGEFQAEVDRAHARSGPADAAGHGAAPGDLERRFGRRLLSVAERAPEGPVAIEVFCWLVRHSRESPEARAAGEILTRHHLRGEGMRRACLSLWYFPCPVAETVLRRALDESRDPEVRGMARLALAKRLMRRLEDGEGPSGEGERRRWRDLDGVRDEAEELLRRAAAEDGGLAHPVLPGTTLADHARSALDELRRFSVGCVAPEIRGRDADGAEFRLGDYRGKVVLLYFGGDWCPFCKEEYPGLRALLRRMEGRPFVLLGVNTDERPELLRRSRDAGDVTWRSWWDGPSGPIARDWNITAWPSAVILDHRGRIRFKGQLYRDAGRRDAALAQLLREAE